MIKYNLRCGQDHGFEVWFRDIDTCDGQIARGQVMCPECGSTDVRKALMAPAVSTSKVDGIEHKRVMAMAYCLHVMRELRQHVDANCDNVGSDFPEEARRIHYGEVEHRNIYGEADLEEAKELIEEGIDILPIPGSFRDDA